MGDFEKTFWAAPTSTAARTSSYRSTRKRRRSDRQRSSQSFVPLFDYTDSHPNARSADASTRQIHSSEFSTRLPFVISPHFSCEYQAHAGRCERQIADAARHTATVPWRTGGGT